MPRAKKTPPPAPSRVYGYTRVSSETQADSGLGLEAQEKTIRDYFRARLRGRARWGGMHVDKGVSATRYRFRARPEAGRLLGKLQRGDHVIVAKLDRAFRSPLDCLSQIDVWQAQGVTLHMLDLQVETGTPTGRLVIAVMSAFAEWEARRIGERIREANAAQRARGRATNGAWTYGHRLVRGRLVPDPAQRKDMARIVALRKRGLYWHQIAAALDKEGRRLPKRQHRGKLTSGRWTKQGVCRAHRAELLLRRR